MDLTETWDIERDLHFLFASDQTLQDELAIVCDLLATSSEDDEKKSRKRKLRPPLKGCRESFESSRRQELYDLQCQVKVLKDKLEETKLNASLQLCTSRWEKLARRQRNEARKAILEQEDLIDAVNSNNTLIEQLKSLLRKKPRLQAIEDEWRVYKLVAHASLRRTAIHAIADRQYNRKDTECINAGLMDRNENFFRVRPLPRTNQKSVHLETVIRATLSAPCQVVSRAVWQVFNGEKTPLSRFGEVALETLDDFTCYERFTETRDGVTSHSNSVRKYFVDDNEHVIIWRSGLEDALAPRSSLDAIEDDSGWIVIEPVTPSQCRMTFLMHFLFNPAMFPSLGDDKNVVSIESIAAGLGRLQMDRDTTTACLGYFPVTPDVFNGFHKPRGFDPFFERGMQFKDAMENSINSAIRAYQRV
ncbi:unnamed protein product [Aphanomyces euteiches]|uniref:START domain-containing protein n=1 Tax=Aphanomyces euteiches TaxID=100861 RepID=A0A6G0X7S1_9STRA|nr:hypothetical protein Ae201684_007645 [Aphanomyces euteiches]KAH9067040.1 hypothetical protein Ae201684P_021212 [Aphanomyces euteiches]KAH9138514.1 hypothetical protein AeRB84_017179 [Aphanomyces euteiches]